MQTSLISLTLPATVPPVETHFLNLGHYQRPGRSLQVNSRYLVLDEQPWMPVMGEFHYSRYPRAEWETELRKIRAGGVQVVASYVIWNHHEAQPGEFNWQGQRDLAAFVDLAAQVGLLVYLRPGPWSHAEVLLGGFPRWLPDTGPLRCNHPTYLGHVQRFFNAIGAQLPGRMWCDGGPVIGVQLENEYGLTGPGCGAEHITELKRLAIEAGLTVPLYTVTGWPTLDIPERDVLPVSGAYADGFWNGARGALPPSGVFLFNTRRVIGEMGNVDGTAASGSIDKTHYPFILAEAGGGMHVAYHRRPVVSTNDVFATTLVQVGSGANLYGYYMYHGGTNPVCATGPLNETQASGYPNDVAQWGYDFHAPLGQYGQVRSSWGRLRTLHQFMQSFGTQLAPTEAVLPDDAPMQADDLARPRVALRGAGDAGFVFINHHVRHHPLPAHRNLQLQISSAHGTHTLPEQPFDLEPGQAFIWPVGMPLGQARLRHATLQPLTQFSLADGSGVWVGFETPGQAIELVFERAGLQHIEAHGLTERADSWKVVLPGSAQRNGQSAGQSDGTERWIQLIDAANRTHHVLVLSAAQAASSLCVEMDGQQRIVLGSHPTVQGGAGELRVHRPADAAASLRIFPATGLSGDRTADGHWAVWHLPPMSTLPVSFSAIENQPAGQPPAVVWGPHVPWRDGPVPCVPAAATQADASPDDAIWTLQLPGHVQAADVKAADGRLMLGVNYIGDVARLWADGEVVDDHFYDGDTWWIGLDRHARTDGSWPTFQISVLPIAADAPIFLEDNARAALLAQARPAHLLDLDARLWRTDTVQAHSLTSTARVA